ncbi:MAG: hypothetical protein ACYDA5_00795 [Vulcanimicrobiaceae bacterium]
MLRPGLWYAVAFAGIALVGMLLLGFATPAQAAGPSCGHMRIARRGVVYEILFAKNGAVQRYKLIKSSNNPETNNDVRLALTKRYGRAGVDTPPLRILLLKPAPNGSGMMIPDKAVDSCGRIMHLN